MSRLRMKSCVLLAASLAACSDRSTPTAPAARPSAAASGGDHSSYTWSLICNGTYYITRDLRLNLTQFSTDINVDLNGGVFPGNIYFYLGRGNQDGPPTGFIDSSISKSGNGSADVTSPASRTARAIARTRSGRSGWCGPVT